MKDMLGKLDGIQRSNTSSYEVDGKPASKADYDKAMSNFKMPDMPKMPNMQGMANNMPGMNVTGGMNSMFKNILQGLQGSTGDDQGLITLPGGSKVNAADFDKFILPPVEVTGKKSRWRTNARRFRNGSFVKFIRC